MKEVGGHTWRVIRARKVRAGGRCVIQGWLASVLSQISDEGQMQVRDIKDGSFPTIYLKEGVGGYATSWPQQAIFHALHHTDIEAAADVCWATTRPQHTNMY